MIRLSLFFSLLLITLPAAAQRYMMGETFDEAAYNALPLKAKISTRSILPPRVSLEQYAPTPGDQGPYGTCSSWASAYHFRTIIEAKQRGVEDQAAIDQLAYSPTWVNEILKQDEDETCNMGLSTVNTLAVFQKLGVPSYASLPFACMTGTREERLTELDAYFEEAQAARIRDLQILFKTEPVVSAEEKIRTIKKVLAEGYPVLVSHILFESFQTAKDVWKVTPQEKLHPEHGRHAMVIVGYDDEKYGGAFRYLNSWGTGWGDGGFTWVPYETTGELCYGAYQAFPFPVNPHPAPAPTPEPPAPAPTPMPSPPQPKPAPAPIAAEAPSGGIEFVLRNGETMPVSRVSTRNLIVEDDDGSAPAAPAYRMREAYPSGTRFRFYLETKVEGYLYAFASDLSRQVNRIFPYDNSVSPLVGRNSIIPFPADTKVIRMDNNPGTDYLMVLFSQQALDVNKLELRMAEVEGGLATKLRAALGDALIDPSQINYAANQVGFEVVGETAGTVVPILIELRHD
ncbi:DUF4384 domain-containing protein [Lewinella sp. 4G2]|uniref:C1 family peptidase n=1 Tax=Lewinella sp. 4G2 TaxID=1803372 RepID=UPI0007DE8534|nr:DUF4384 domain-containing protein [Lewinella sp. 4G2]OAV44974.1 hypothetical protein A3850_010925 [Lewinella sp. 4G2]